MKQKIQKNQILERSVLLLIATVVILMAILLPNNLFDTRVVQASGTDETELVNTILAIDTYLKANNKLYINNETQLKALAQYVNNGNDCLNKEIILLDNLSITLNLLWEKGKYFNGLFNEQFNGIFNGNDYTIEIVIENAQLNDTEDGMYRAIALFNKIGERGKVTRLNTNIKVMPQKINPVPAADALSLLGIAYYNYGTIDKCESKILWYDGTSSYSYTADYCRFYEVAWYNKGTINACGSYRENNNVCNNFGTFTWEQSFYMQGYSFVQNYYDIYYTAYKKNQDGTRSTIDEFKANKVKMDDTVQFRIQFPQLYVKTELGGSKIKLDSTITNITRSVPNLSLWDSWIKPVSIESYSGYTFITYEIKGSTLKDLYESVEANQYWSTFDFNYLGLALNFKQSYSGSAIEVYIQNSSGEIETVACTEVISYKDIGMPNYIQFDDTKPNINTTLNVDGQTSGTFGKEEKITINVTSTTPIRDTDVVPVIEVNFDGNAGKYNSGKAKFVEGSNLVLDKNGNTTWKYEYVIKNGDNGKLSIKYTSGTLVALSGNTIDLSTKGTSSYNAIIADSASPTLEITSDHSSPTNAKSITYTFTFSEDVTGFTTEDITVTNGTKGTFLGSGKVYTLVVTDGETGDQIVSVAAEKCLDSVGNGNVAASKTITIDLTSLTVAITTDKTSPTNSTSPIKYSFNFSKPVIDFTEEDITVTYGTKGTFSGSGDSYTLIVTPTVAEGESQRVGVIIERTGFTDEVGNTLKGDRAKYIRVDRMAPTLEIRADKTSPTNASSIIYEFAFREEVIGFTSDDITVTSGSISDFSYLGSVEFAIQDYRYVYTAKVTPTVENGEVEVSIAAGKFTDLAGNGNVAASKTITIDRTSLTVAITTDKTSPTNSTSPIKYSFNFSKPVIDFTEEDISVTYGTKGTFSGSGDSYTLMVTPTVAEGESQSVGVRIERTGFTDEAGNTLKGTRAMSVRIDREVPGLYMRLDKESPTNASSIIYEFAFREEVIGFTSDDITVTGGSVGDFSYLGYVNFEGENNRYVYTAKVTPTVENGEVEVSIAAGKFTDLAGNGNVAASKTITIDRTAPTITFNQIPSEINKGETLDINITTSEEAKISYSWSGTTWEETTEYKESSTINKTFTEVGTNTLKVKAIDKLGNESEVKTLEIKVVEVVVQIPEITFDKLETAEKDGIIHVKVSAKMTIEAIKADMNQEKLYGKTPEFTNLTQDGKLKTGSQITLDGETKYTVVIKGDVNSDGQINLNDAIRMLQHRAGGENPQLKNENLLAAELSNAGNVTLNDVIKVMRYKATNGSVEL